jgi:phosphatidate cytidylyltransferase
VSNNVQRVLVAAIAIPLLIGIGYLGGLPLAILITLVAALGTHELLGIAARQGQRPLAALAILVSIVVPLGVWIEYGGSLVVLGSLGALSLPSTWYALAGVVILVLTATLAWRTPADRPLEVAAITLLAPLYCAVLPSFLLGIRYALGGPRSWPATWAVFFPLAVTWVCDSFAMWGGKLIGGPKLAPVVSPGKTRSGFVAGLIGGVLAALVFNRLAMVPSGFTLSTAQVILFGLTLSAIGTVGDLAESLFKREAGVKDSSGLIPGHGGVLDRLDSLYFVIPVSAMLYRLFGIV